jgi:lipopolysaccharide export LptBFGC system permease protein LptF
MATNAIVADRRTSRPQLLSFMRFPVAMFALTLVFAALVSLFSRATTIGFLVPSFIVCFLVSLANLLAQKLQRSGRLG